MIIKLKEQRKRQRISQYRLSRLTGVSRFRISLAESGYIQLAREEIETLLKAISTYKLNPSDTKGVR